MTQAKQKVVDAIYAIQGGANIPSQINAVMEYLCQDCGGKLVKVPIPIGGHRGQFISALAPHWDKRTAIDWLRRIEAQL